MTDQPESPPETDRPETDETDAPAETGTPDTPDEPENTPEAVPRSELDKAIARRDKATARARELQAELDKLKKADEPDPLAAANKRLVTAEAKSVLTTAGVTDKDAQKAVLGLIDLSRIDVDGDGEVDTGAIEDIVSTLKKAFAVKAERVPAVRPRPGTGGETTDPDKARRLRFFQARKTR